MVAHQVHSNSRYTFQEAMNQPVEIAREYPLSSMLVIFGVGLGVGAIVSQVACSSLEGFFEEPTLAERIRRQIMSTVNDVLPSAVSQQLARFQQ